MWADKIWCLRGKKSKENKTWKEQDKTSIIIMLITQDHIITLM